MRRFDPRAVLRKLRTVCRRLPDVEETTSFGHPTFKVGGKTFAVFERYKDRWSIAFKADPVLRDGLLAAERFYVTPYLGKHRWISLDVGMSCDWREIRVLIATSHGLLAEANPAKVPRTRVRRGKRRVVGPTSAA